MTVLAEAATGRDPASAPAPAPVPPIRPPGPEVVGPGLVDGVAAAVSALLAGLPVGVVVGYAAAVVVLVSADGGHRPRLTTLVGPRVPRLALAAGLPLPVLVLLAPDRTGAVAAVTATGLAAVLVPVGRALSEAVLRRRRRRRDGRPALVVGAGTTGLRLAGVLADRPEHGLLPLGVLDDAGPATVHGAGPAWLGPVADLPGLVDRLGVRDVVVAPSAAEEGAAPLPDPARGELEAVVRATRRAGARVWVVPRLPRTGLAVPLGLLDDVRGTVLVPLRGVPDDGAVSARLLRAGERLLAAGLLVLVAPVLGLAALLGGPGRLAGPGTAFFRQWRVGRHGRPVRVVKLRTVVDDPDRPDSDTAWVAPDHRVTGWGRLVRRSRLDELPQLAGVLRGDLALVGPRPERPAFAARFLRAVPGYADRLHVRPGLTGWAQVHGLVGDTSLEERARFDSQYVEYRSVWLDTVILLRTLAALRLAPEARAAGAPDIPGGRP